MQTIYDDRYRRAVSFLTHTRHKLGLSQYQVAHSIGWRRTMLSNIERYERRIDILEAAKLVGALGLQLSALESLLTSDKDDESL